MPQTHAPGEQAEVDFGDVWLALAGEKTPLLHVHLPAVLQRAAVHRV